MKKILLTLTVLLVTFTLTLSAYAERVLVVGDSITAQSIQNWGYTPMVRKALADAGVNDVTFVPFGCSGNTISGWIGLVENSKTNENLHGDRAEILFKPEFDLGADTIIIFLGMNDVLCPLIQDTPEGYAKWKADYCTLIDALRARTPMVKRILLCPPTMLTENPYSYKNKMMDKMGEIMAEVAEEKNAEVLDLRGEIKRFFMSVRFVNNDFHFTPDCVHPNTDGHRVMAWTFLRGIGQETAAQKIYDDMPGWLKDFNTPGMSLFVLNSAEAGKMQIRGHVRKADKKSIQVACPAGWKLDEIVEMPGDAFEIRLSGHSPALTSQLTVTAEGENGTIERKIAMNAPFFVSQCFDGKPFHGGDSYDATATRTPIDDAILAGQNPMTAQVDGKPVKWTVYYPQADVTGFNLPCGIDFASIENGFQFQTAYVVRKVYSPKAQTASMTTNALSFSTMAYPTVYVNGKQVFEGCVSPRHKTRTATFPIELKEGENIVAVRVGHFTWQWAEEFIINGEGLEY